MMKEMNESGQEEYIWAMRTSAHQERDSKLWKQRRSTVTPKIGHMGKLISKSFVEGSLDDKQTKVVASLVPDEVICNVNDYSHRQYEACFLFGDVSGFTDLCETYSKEGISGPSRMTAVLNKYLGSMVQEVLSYNGDVLKFSGDAFLAIFKSTESDTLRDAVHEALDCALIIQKDYGAYQTDVGVVIRVKLAISAGLVTFALIGDASNSHYVVVGKPIWDVKAAESLCSAGDIAVAPAAWHYINTNEYLYKEMPDGIHIKLLGVGPSWRSVQRIVRQHKQKEETENTSLKSKDSSSLLSNDSEGERRPPETEEFYLRPAVNVAVRLKLKESLRKFIIAPVMNSIDMDEPFEYLTEMRQAVIVFINIVTRKLKTEETVILSDQAYKIVCGVVNKMKGCVNKVSLFDKDLMFVVIFGLRGLKHELECQIALRCASDCHKAINQLPGVLSASIGVTTGKTYCGVFGHTLRREYTVISLIVNKAARIMVAYKGKVTCDRDTFLHSKLEARNFILQEFKPLKGISHPGPVYEFREVEIDYDQQKKIDSRPMLGRDDRLKTYESLLAKCMKPKPNDEQYKIFFITGEARQGKTRLLDETILITPPEVPIHKITLTIEDSKIPYQTLRLLFFKPLRLNPQSSVKQKEQKLLTVLGKIQDPDMLCVLNSLFGVNFKNSDLYFSLSEEAKVMAQRKLIKKICYAIFHTLWVLAIDDCEYVDKQSWDLIEPLIEIKTLFIIATMGRDRLVDVEHTEKIMKNPRCKVVHLKPLPVKYLGALACQILNVYAISPELEKAIQNKSHGNPGWVENFLISSLQDKSLWILKASLKEIDKLGLVCPPLYMMARLTKEETAKWRHIMEERRCSQNSLTDDGWKEYVDSCRNSYLNVTVREQMEGISVEGKVPICVISSSFQVGDEEAELSMDAMVLKTFDSLNFYEQLLVKCSAILGNQFLRNMLLYVMSAKDKRKAALAIQRLFEIKVLTCAKGDFFEEGTSVFQERLINPNDETELKCKCKGVRVDEVCMDLPRYASCGFLQFRSQLFREITYNLLTDQQKKEFHNRAIRYLERETRKCKACGNGVFEHILGEETDREMKNAVKKEKTGYSNEFSVSGSSISLSRKSSRSRKSRTSSLHSGHSGSAISTHRGSKISKKSGDDVSVASFSKQITEEEKKNKLFLGSSGLYIIHKLKNSFSLTKTYSNEDFTDCQCHLILSTTYAQLIEHSRGANEINKQLEAMLEYSRVSIFSCNIPLALIILENGLKIIQQKMKHSFENKWKLTLIRGKMYTLIGYCRLELGQLSEAMTNLHASLKEYGVKFPRGFSQKLKKCSSNFKIFTTMFLIPRYLIKRMDYWTSIYSNNLAECLSHLCTLYMIKGQWQNAELAAAWSFQKGVEAFNNFQVLSVVWANLLVINQHFKRWDHCLALEIHAMRMCHLKKDALEAQDLQCVAKLYSVIFLFRLTRSKLDKAIHIGYIILRQCTSLRAITIILPLLPLLLHSLLMGKHFTNVYSILQELEFFAADDTDSSGRVWYYSLCVTLQLETGYAVLPYHICESFYQIEGQNWITIRDPDARRRFYTVMWLWCVRNEKWEAASLWCLKTSEFLVISENNSLDNKITALYLLEGMIVFLVSKLDKRNIRAVITTENQIENLFIALEKASKSATILLPRLYHLKAYYKYVRNVDADITDLIKKAKKYAIKCGNILELDWIDHSTKAWSYTLPAPMADFWREHSEPDNILDFQEIGVEERKVGFYTLPMPVYV